MEDDKKYVSCLLAGGCFWCVAMPYYEKKGILKVISGYTGGSEIDAVYEKVKKQETMHRECIKLIYNENIISYQEILDIYFKIVDPFDSSGQYIDRGNSYTLALYYSNEKMKQEITTYIRKIESENNKKVAISVLCETEFFIAEEYHQDYAIKNPKEMEEELQKSGRSTQKLNLKQRKK